MSYEQQQADDVSRPTDAGFALVRARARWRRGTLGALILLLAFGAAVWFGCDTVLRAAADLWIVSDQPAPADAVAVFGGGLEIRPFAAAAYYREGLVKKVVLSNVRPSPAELLGVLQSHADANRKVLIKLGVPDSAIESFGADVSNTYEEAQALRAWAARSGARRIIVPTEIFSARRTRWMLRRVFAGEATILVPALVPLEYRSDNWWKSEGGLIGFENEVLKYLYYRIKY
jgi:uncharacterized SAM-binding protein YcdF (DUF218 family)